MRILAALFLLVLASCASHPSSRDAYSGSGAVMLERNSFTSHARVDTPRDAQLAKMTAYMRLKEKAEAEGYSYFRVDTENADARIGYRYSVSGRLYRKMTSGTYPLLAIDNILNGKPLDLGDMVVAVRSEAEVKSDSEIGKQTAIEPAVIAIPDKPAKSVKATKLVKPAKTKVTKKKAVKKALPEQKQKIKQPTKPVVTKQILPEEKPKVIEIQEEEPVDTKSTVKPAEVKQKTAENEPVVILSEEDVAEMDIGTRKVQKPWVPIWRRTEGVDEDLVILGSE